MQELRPRANSRTCTGSRACGAHLVGRPDRFQRTRRRLLQLNVNHPADGNQLYNFDVKANQFSLNMAKLSMSHTADPVGFQVDFGFGRAFDIIHASEPAVSPSFLRNIEQAYVSLKPAKWKGSKSILDNSSPAQARK